MTNRDLDSQCALARGWHIQKREGTPFDWWHHGHKPMSPIDAYTPSTDLNQAVDFAEWVSEQTGRGWDLGRPNKKRQHNFVARHALKIAHGNNPAEALCRATLAALGKGEKRG